MKFFELTYPDYTGDSAMERHNPILMLYPLTMPSIICRTCDNEWRGFRPVYLEMPNPKLRRRVESTRVLVDEEWRALEREVRADVGARFELEPGDVLGHPAAELGRSNLTHDILHPFLGLVVTKRIVEALAGAGLTGYRALPTQLRWSVRAKGHGRLPHLFQIVVDGRAWREGSSYGAIVDCRACGRTVFPRPNCLTVDEKRWDGSDFFNLDLNPGRAFVTERVKDVLESQQFTNYRCVSING
jgi:hypothetical protein